MGRALVGLTDMPDLFWIHSPSALVSAGAHGRVGIRELTGEDGRGNKLRSIPNTSFQWNLYARGFGPLNLDR